MAEETIWTLEIDASDALDTLNAIDEALSTLSASFDAISQAASGLSAIDDALSGVDGAASAVDSSLSSLDANVDNLLTSVDGLDEALASLDGDLANAAGSSDLLDEAISTLNTALSEDTALIDNLNGTISNLQAQLDMLTASEDEAAAGADNLNKSASGLQAAQGPLMMLGMAGLMAGKSIYDAGTKGQEGEALLRGMAGASQQDINSLQQAAINLGVGMDQASQGFYQVESAGYAGKDAITVFDSAMKLAEGGQAQAKDTMSALTAIMHDYNASADQATNYTDIMAEAVKSGKQSMSDFASAIGPLASSGENVGLSFDQVAAAESTMTQINPHVAQDAQQLTSLFNFLSPTMGGVEKAAKSLGLSFDEQKYSSADLLGKLQMLSDMAGGTNTAAFVKLTGGVRGSTAAIDLLKNNASSFKSNLDAMGHATGATQQAFDQFQNTVPAHMDHVSASLSVFSTKFMDAVGPKIIPIIDHVSDAIGFLADHMDIAIPIMSGLAVVIGGVVVAALWAMLAPLFAITVTVGTLSLPFLAIAAIVAGVVAVIVLAVMHWGQIVDWLKGVWSGFSGWFMGVLGAIGGFFTGIWTHIADFFKGLWAGIVSGLHTAWDAIVNVVRAGAALLVAVVMGPLYAIVGGFEWLYNHNYYFKALVDTIVNVVKAGLAWLQTAWTDSINWLIGAWQNTVKFATDLWNTISNAVHDGWNKAVQFVSDIWAKISSYFSNAWNTYISGPLHTLWSNVSSVFSSAWGTYVSGPLGNLWNNMVNMVNGWSASATQWGINLIQGFINGITSMIGNVGNAVSQIAGKVGALLGFHSPAKEGPGSTADLWGPNLIEMMAQGIESREDRLQDAAQSAAGVLASGLNPELNTALMASIQLPGNLNPATGGIGGNNQTTQLLMQMVAYLAQMVQLQQQRRGNVTMNNSFGSGPVNAQQLAQVLQSIFGYQYEGLSRGAGTYTGAW